jgi:hypothetical protein
MLERIRANRVVALAGATSNYSLPATTSTSTFGAGPNCLTAACSSAAMASSDVAGWLALLASTNGLPSGEGSITFGSLNTPKPCATEIGGGCRKHTEITRELFWCLEADTRDRRKRVMKRPLNG